VTEPSDLLEVIAHAVTAILATWLGLIVLTRARRRPGAGIFALLAAYLVAWSVAILVQRLTGDPAIVPGLKAVEDAAAFLLPAGTLHIALAMSVEGRRSTAQHVALIASYALCGAMAVGAVLAPDAQFAVDPPEFAAFGVPGAVYGWAWIGARIVIFAAAVYWIVRALRISGTDTARVRQLQATLATVAVGAGGGIIRFLPGPADSDPWVGVSLVTLAVLLAAYAVFAQGLFLAPDAADQAFRYSVFIGLGVTVYVAVLVGLERAAQQLLDIGLPIVTGLALVVTIALFDPAARWVRGVLRSRDPLDTAHDRLLQALGQDLITAQRPDGAVQPALARLSRTFRLTGALVLDPAGQEIARHGQPDPDSPVAVRLPLHSGGTKLGTAVFGPKRSLLPVAPRESELLAQAAGYLAASLRLAERHDEQAAALSALSAEREAVETRGSVLSEALVEARAPASGFTVFALGPLRVEREGELVRQWGGAKAGTRQAEALFAFLLDRGERGVAKDEVLEMVWPDVDLERADLAFHRTLGGLRTTLEPGRRGGDRGAAITFHNDRYRLNPSLVSWTDVAAFEDEIAVAGAEADPERAIRHLERARSLYRGDYLDDCPFYGDSAHVEERRELLRGRFVDLLLALGQQYEARGDRPTAAARFREARLAAGDELPTADEALGRLGGLA